MPIEFERAWSDLNLRLKEVELGAGLPAALIALEARDRDSGFLKDTLQPVERHTFSHPDDPARHYRVQYNPRRALRSTAPLQDHANPLQRNGSCVLCRENIQWQQKGLQLGYRVETGERGYFALMNPFPLLPAHTNFASTEHRPQDWRFRNESGLDAAALICDLVKLADRMPGHLGFYNGVGAGASIPGHLHYQFVMRPQGEGEFPLEIAARNAGGGKGGPGFVEQYPLEVAVWKGDADDVAARASDWIVLWAERNRERLDGLTSNLIASRDLNSGNLVFYFVPRDRAKSRPGSFSSLAGVLEVLGEIVLSTRAEKAQLDAGLINYLTLETALASLHTPLEIE